MVVDREHTGFREEMDCRAGVPARLAGAMAGQLRARSLDVLAAVLHDWDEI